MNDIKRLVYMQSHRCAFFSGLEHLIILMLFATQDSVSFNNIVIHAMNPSLSSKNVSIDRKYLWFKELFNFLNTHGQQAVFQIYQICYANDIIPVCKKIIWLILITNQTIFLAFSQSLRKKNLILIQ